MKKIISVSALTVLLTACAADDPNKRMKTGAAVGAAAGAAAGYAVDRGTGGALVGAAVGALAGGAVGRYMDNQQREMEAILAEQETQHAIELQRMEDESLKINVSNEISFDFDSAALKPAFMPTLENVAGVLQRYPRTVIHVVGHTDSIGSDSYNMQLSQRRAQSVANYFSGQGVTQDRLVVTGRGKTEPRASNDTEAGRQLNRRVEIYVKPIIEGQESEAYQTPRSYQ